jgi:hypothetical protein
MVRLLIIDIRAIKHHVKRGENLYVRLKCGYSIKSLNTDRWVELIKEK